MMIRTADDVGHLVRGRRKQLGLSQAQLADKVGVSRQWIVGLEGGKRTAEVALVLRTIAVLGLQLDARDPRQHADSAAAAIIAAGQVVLDRHRPAGERRTLRTRPPRKPIVEPDDFVDSEASDDADSRALLFDARR